MQGNAYDYDQMGNRYNEQNIRIITRTNKKTGTTTEYDKKKVWNYQINSLNQYSDIIAMTGVITVT